MNFKDYLCGTDFEIALHNLAKDAIFEYPYDALTYYNDYLEDNRYYDEIIRPIEDLDDSGMSASEIVKKIDYDTFNNETEYYYYNHGYITGITEEYELANVIIYNLEKEEINRIGIAVLAKQFDLPEDMEKYPELMEVLREYGLS